MQCHLAAHGGDELVEQARRECLVDGVHRRKAGHAAQPARKRGGQRRLVELDHHRCLEPPGEFRAVGGEPLGQRSGQVAHRTPVGDRPVPAGEFEVRGQGDRPGRLHLHGAARTPESGLLPRLFERVHVLVEQAGGPAHRGAAARGDPVAARHGVDADVDEQRGRSADHVGAHAPRG